MGMPRSGRTIFQRIPEYLHPFVVEQDATQYTAIDHASWRFIMTLSKQFFAEHAHQKYLDGLRETGISTDRIPLISEMDEALSKFGWGAVGISGFIPPGAFLEFLSHRFLPIACEMRKLENLAYTPAFDIVHEAAGHAPIVADRQYAAYLEKYAEAAHRAIYSAKDMEVYDAIYNLSVTKEDPEASDAQIAKAQERLDAVTASVTYVSESTYLARMAWWTIEYGLVGGDGTPENPPKIYGAGLLSSVGESFHCLGKSVRQIPFTLDCINTGYDITKPQPQLFVAQSFDQLGRELEAFAQTMAYRRGGYEGLAKAKMAAAVTTTELDTGIQISGIVERFLTDADGRVSFVQYSGPCQLSSSERELSGHGVERHGAGFSAPLGRLRVGSGPWQSPKALTDADLRSGSEGVVLEFESGIRLQGKLQPLSSGASRPHPHLFTFESCEIRWGDRVLYRREWGPFDWAAGERVVSVAGHAADRSAYLKATGQFDRPKARQKTNLKSQDPRLVALYAEVRKIREQPGSETAKRQALDRVVAELDREFPEDWLLRFEVLELTGDSRCAKALNRIATMSVESSPSAPEVAELIKRGLAVLQ